MSKTIPTDTEIATRLNALDWEPQIVFYERGSADWDQVWALLATSTGGDVAQRCDCCGEAWQYMGTFATGTDTAHEFRHRHCPTTQQREYRRFTATPIVEPRGATHEVRPLAELLSPAAQALLSLLTRKAVQ